jgi:hypothetical protein
MNSTLGQVVVDACRILATCTSSPKSLKVLMNANILLSSRRNIIIKLRYVLLRYDKDQILNLSLLLS